MIWALNPCNYALKVREQSKDSEISYVHVKRSANGAADPLAKEGVGSQDLSFVMFDN